MKKLLLIIGLFFALNSQAQFSASFEHPYSLGYGLLYNWFCTQPQARPEYGYLYNYFVVKDIRNIANTGWHISTLADCNALDTYLGGATVSGGKLKETGLTHWTTPNIGATNEIGFNLVGNGRRDNYGVFSGLTITGSWWAQYSTEGQRRQAMNGAIALASGNAGFLTVGLSIRPVKDSTTLTNGQVGSYTGNDGKVYKTICIGTQEWASSDLMETKYRDGSAIPEVTDNTAWAALTTGARCSYNNVEANAGTTVSIAPVGWHVPTWTEWNTLIGGLGGSSIAGGKLKETGFSHWLDPNTGATNDALFNALGTAYRGESGSFTVLKEICIFWMSEEYWYDANYGLSVALSYDNTNAPLNTGNPKHYGQSVRLIKDDPSTWTAGDAVTDYDGNVYQTVKIGTQVWTASNWKCTHYRNGGVIPNVTNDTAWAALTTGAWCVYNNQMKYK